MKELYSLKEAIQTCIENKYFSIAHLQDNEKQTDMQLNDCYEIYYSISGNEQFLIDDKAYTVAPGDIFLINQYESHFLKKLGKDPHESVVIAIHPDFIKEVSSKDTNLDFCFHGAQNGFIHRLSLTSEEQTRFVYFINRILTENEFAHDLLERALITESLVMINALSRKASLEEQPRIGIPNEQVNSMLSYINKNIPGNVSIARLASEFYISESYTCRVFKATTGTTVNKYISGRRISFAKKYLAQGESVADACVKCGYSDYSNFLKAFTKLVGVPPKKYSQNVCKNQ